jgi:hypothetical protein
LQQVAIGVDQAGSLLAFPRCAGAVTAVLEVEYRPQTPGRSGGAAANGLLFSAEDDVC